MIETSLKAHILPALLTQVFTVQFSELQGLLSKVLLVKLEYPDPFTNELQQVLLLVLAFLPFTDILFA